MNITEIVKISLNGVNQIWRFQKDGIGCLYYTAQKGTLMGFDKTTRKPIYESATWIYEGDTKIGALSGFMSLDVENPKEGIEKFYKLLMLQQ